MHFRDCDDIEQVPESTNSLTISSTEDTVQQAFLSFDRPAQKITGDLSSFEQVHLG
eukprot:CAMPEP_0172926490 /NCGR_PEP_ID=MMETSP1075-20121228/215640_1 /TAXON_ID=2916 /ORGANISM="Ceratium fusus, Strain PA161109" /LENGTH=55 /DNA_ID=CAMNT_0013787557 /DNA_START=153 /DNA_END=316 /DNA_ORIENTATION=+